MRIIEVGPRDGLQNEAIPIPTDVKLRFIGALIAAGLREIEVTSFVSPKWVPQLADADEVWRELEGHRAQGTGHRGCGKREAGSGESAEPSQANMESPDACAGERDLGTTAAFRAGTLLFSALVPNVKGLERALAVGVRRIALFTAASDEFTRRNINMSVAESFNRFAEVIDIFRGSVTDGWVRGYVSTAFECPYAGGIDPGRVSEVAGRLFQLGVDEVSLGDTIGVAVPKEVRAVAKTLTGYPNNKIAWHFHNTRGTAIANVSAALDLGYEAFDASAGGLGGCPYAPGAGGNVATEDVVYFLERSGVPTGVDLAKLAEASAEVLSLLGRPSAANLPR